jgi:phosphoenolpyruvate synthase/pyruvate phosphate dikinase
LRGLMNEDAKFLPHAVLVKDLHAIMMKGLGVPVHHPLGATARQVCRYFHDVALKNATEEEKKYLPIILRRIERGNLSEILRQRILDKSRREDFREAIIDIYSELVESLTQNRPYF